MSDEEQKPKNPDPESPDKSRQNAEKDRKHPRLLRAVVSELKAELQYSGPLPPPNMLAAYRDAFPECPERIVAMAECAAAHRHEMERADLQGAIKLRGRGQFIGGTLALVGLVGGIYLLAHDKSVAGYALLLGNLAVFGGAFMYGRFFRRSEDEKPAVPAKRETPPVPEKQPVA